MRPKKSSAASSRLPPRKNLDRRGLMRSEEHTSALSSYTTLFRSVMFSAVAHCAARDKHAAEEIIRCLITPAAKEKLRSAGFDEIRRAHVCTLVLHDALPICDVLGGCALRSKGQACGRRNHPLPHHACRQGKT